MGGGGGGGGGAQTDRHKGREVVGERERERERERESATNSVNLHTWRSDGSVQSDSIFLFKPPKLSFPHLFSPGLITVMLSLLALLRFSLMKFKE